MSRKPLDFTLVDDKNSQGSESQLGLTSDAVGSGGYLDSDTFEKGGSYAYDFGNFDGYVALDHYYNFGGQTDFTWEAVVKTDKSDENIRVASYDASEFYRVRIKNGNLQALLRDNSNSTTTLGTTTTIADGRWHHIAFVIGGGNGTLYLDGSAEDTENISDFGTGATRYGYIAALSEGSSFDGNTNFGGYQFDGSVARMSHYKGDALSQSQIQTLADGKEVSPTPESRWRFTEGGGGIVTNDQGTGDGYIRTRGSTAEWIERGTESVETSLSANETGTVNDGGATTGVSATPLSASEAASTTLSGSITSSIATTLSANEGGIVGDGGSVTPSSAATLAATARALLCRAG